MVKRFAGKDCRERTAGSLNSPSMVKRLRGKNRRFFEFTIYGEFASRGEKRQAAGKEAE